MKDQSGFPANHKKPDYLTASPPVQPRQSRRANFHDYRAPGYYMITATTKPNTQCLSRIPELPASELKKGEMIIPINTPLGECIRKEILDIPTHHPEIRIILFVIMPDHIHIVINVHTRLKRKLGNELAGFFGACSGHHDRLTGSREKTTLFNRFHDRIIFNHLQLDRAIKYVEDNPRRLIIKRMHPDLFRKYMHIKIAGHEYAAYGNIFLLKEIYLLPIRIHRRWSEQEFNEYAKKCREEIEKGAIPISPAIHKAEKAIMNDAIAAGHSVIQLTDKGFEERFKPKGVKFELCAQGRLLLLAPWPDNTGRASTAGYSEFHQMNDLAVRIASTPPGARMTIIDT